jgi:hypothetical protein
MSIVLCPGIHPSSLSEAFQQGVQQALEEQSNLQRLWQKVLIFPVEQFPAYSALHIIQFMQQELEDSQQATLFIAFSAGVVGAIAAAWQWQQMGRQVSAFIALDGWGVPLYGSFPIHRISHDYFTHWSSALLGDGEDSFYADPAVEHLDVWRSPQTVQGWWISSTSPNTRRHTTQATFLTELLKRYVH